MKHFYLIFFLSILISTPLNAQYSIAWAKTFGGEYWDEAHCAIETWDNYVVIAGYKERSESSVNMDGYTTSINKRGAKYCWLLKVDQEGNEWWGRADSLRLDVPRAEARSIKQCADSGLIVAGTCFKTKKTSSDFWLLKTDTYGKKMWEVTFGDRNANEEAFAVVETYDGGFVMAGYTDNTENLDKNLYIVKTDAFGNKLWEDTWGGDKDDCALDLIETSDFGIVLTGYTGSGGGARTTWMIRYSADGAWEFQETYPTGLWDIGTGIIEAYDHGILICGLAKVEGAVNYDVRLIKTDPLGYFQWAKTYGDVEWEEATDLCETFDKGIAIAGFTKSIGGEYDDFWILYTDRDGELIWEQSYGGSGFDYANYIIETRDRGLLVVGGTYSNEHYGWDFAVLKLKRDGISDYLLPGYTFVAPRDSSTITFEDTFNLEVCLRSIDTLKNVEIYINDSLYIASAPFFYTPGDSICNATITARIPLNEGENRVSLKAENLAGRSTSQVFRLYYILLLKVDW